VICADLTDRRHQPRDQSRTEPDRLVMEKPGSSPKPLRPVSVGLLGATTPMEIEMEPKRIAAVAALTVAMAAPTFAHAAQRGAHRLQQERTYRHAQERMSRHAQERMSRPAYRYGYHPAYRYAYRPVYRYGTGFWPADVAAGIVGGAIGTAGAIAAAPFGAGPYAYYNGPYAY
jgi:hypothetical protein